MSETKVRPSMGLADVYVVNNGSFERFFQLIHTPARRSGWLVEIGEIAIKVTRNPQFAEF